jgi:hypothetical protein
MLVFLDDLRAASTTLQRAKTNSAKKALDEACAKMRASFITLSPDLREARENFEFFDRLCSSSVRNVEAIIALTVKLIGSEFVAEHDQRLLLSQEDHSRPSPNPGELPVPKGFGAELAKAMKTRGDGLEAACAHMGEMDPKTLRKLLNERGLVHRGTLNRAYNYVHSIAEPPRKSPKIP